MKNKPILIVAGEPNSIFSEIFFKAFRKNKFSKPIILIVSKNLILKQMKKLKFRFNVNIINQNNINFNKLQNKDINIINIDYKFKEPFEKIS